MNAELSVKKTIEKNSLVSEGDILILGLSGGPDSLSLLHILAGLRKSKGFVLKALHVNHLMRGEAASEDVEFLKKVCEELDVELYVRECDVYARAESEGISPEEAGRKARHEALFAAREEEGDAALIVLAHNRDDQAETVLMRLLRGTGIHGLSAMEYRRPDGIIRPLLDTPRCEIEKYCSAHNLNPRYDVTNGDPSYTRNKLRLVWIPKLEESFNPSLKEGLVRLAASAREDDDALNAIADEWLAANLSENSLDRKEAIKLHPAVFKRAVRKIFWDLGLREDIAAYHLNNLWDAVTEKRSGIFEFPQGYYAEIRSGRIRFACKH